MSDDTTVGISGLTVDAVRERNPTVDERMSELESRISELQNDSEALESIRAALGIDDDVSITDAIEALQNHAQRINNELIAYKTSKLNGLRQSISDSSGYEMHELEEMDEDQLLVIQDALEHIPESDYTLKTATNDTSESSSDDVSNSESVDPRTLYSEKGVY